MDVIKFNCSSCGSCCRRVGDVLDTMKNLGFPYNANDKGHCEMLAEDNKRIVTGKQIGRAHV